MGEYFLCVCVHEDGRLVACFNPHHGFGGLKWCEFLGTDAGKRLLQLLEEEFCPKGCKWGIVSDYGYVSIDVKVDVCPKRDLYEEAEQTRDFALNASVRKRAIELGITTQSILKRNDEMTEATRHMFKDEDLLHYEAADVSAIEAEMTDLSGWIVEKAEGLQRACEVVGSVAKIVGTVVKTVSDLKRHAEEEEREEREERKRRRRIDVKDEGGME